MSRTVIDDVNTRIDVSKIRAYDEHIFVRYKENERTASGIIVPHGERTECAYGEVLDVGPGSWCEATGKRLPIENIHKGDWVMTVKYQGSMLEAEGQKYAFIRQHGIWAKLKVEVKQDRLDILDVEPYADRLVVKYHDETKSRGGLHLPGNPQVKYATATVVAVGPGDVGKQHGDRRPMPVQPGWDIVVLRYAGCKLKGKTQEYRIIQIADIVASAENVHERD
jgi:co-chaperonin GroES (HSP10)